MVVVAVVQLGHVRVKLLLNRIRAWGDVFMMKMHWHMCEGVTR